MPSPFPGMDPYLESDLWTSFHAMLGVELVKDRTTKEPAKEEAAMTINAATVKKSCVSLCEGFMKGIPFLKKYCKFSLNGSNNDRKQ